MPSSSRQNPALPRYSGRGAGTTAIAPRPGGNCANSVHADSVTMRLRAGGTVSRSLRMPSRSSADSTTIKVSGAPCRSQYTAMTCSPSSTQRPALRRSREDATSRAACLRRGLSLELTRGIACAAQYESVGRGCVRGCIRGVTVIIVTAPAKPSSTKPAAARSNKV